MYGLCKLVVQKVKVEVKVCVEGYVGDQMGLYTDAERAV